MEFLQPKQWGQSVWNSICSAVRFFRQKIWWRWSERWPLSSIIIFIKALLLLALWLAVALLVFDVIISPRIQAPEEKTLSLLGVLITALIGFGVQQWKSQTEEAAKRKQEVKVALQEVSGLSPAFRDNLSDGARLYLELSTRGGGVWKTSRVQSALEEERNVIKPTELQDALRLFKLAPSDERFFREAETIGYQRSVEALEWVYKELDDVWRKEASDKLIFLSQQPEYRGYITADTLRDLEEAYQWATLRLWPHLSLWRNFPPSVDPGVAKGLEYFGREDPPFGSGQAETDTLLLTRPVTVPLPWRESLQEPRPTLLIGPSGSGKTALALLTVYNSFREQEGSSKRGFPIYFPLTSSIPELDEVAKVTAKTLLYHLAAVPSAFLKRSTDKRGGIAHLLARYAQPNLALRFYQAGLPRGGKGNKLLEEIENLTQKSSFQEQLTDSGVLTLLSQARPRSFRYSIILLDVQEQAGKELTGPEVGTLINLSDELARNGVFVKSFLPDVRPVREQIDQSSTAVVELEWPDALLFELLENYLRHFGDDSLAAWCDPELKGESLKREDPSSPDSRLVRAAGGTPRGLIRKGNELLRRIGQKGQVLEAQDLDDILGPLPGEGE